MVRAYERQQSLKDQGEVKENGSKSLHWLGYMEKWGIWGDREEGQQVCGQQELKCW